MEYKITENQEEILRIGHQIMADNPRRYPEALQNEFMKEFREFIPDEERLKDLYYGAIYCQQMYGSSLIEYGMYRFKERTHAEKSEYVTWFNRYIYMAFLNRQKDLHLLDNKYEAYTLLKPYYKREAMVVSSWADYDAFCSFAARHRSMFVKPINLELAEGVHRIEIDRESDIRSIFSSLIDEAESLTSEDITRPIDHRLIIEEEIIQSREMAKFNPYVLSLLRVTTILVKDTVHFFYPCIRIMTGDGKSQISEMYSVDALIDAESGIVLTDGIESRWTIECHPMTGTKIKGFRMPEWDALKTMLDDAARKLPTLRYIGWDVAHTDNGWCIIEGNTNGELCMSQMCVGHGVKSEFEDIIGFHVPYGFMLERVEQIIEDKKNKRYEEQNRRDIERQHK